MSRARSACGEGWQGSFRSAPGLFSDERLGSEQLGQSLALPIAEALGLKQAAAGVGTVRGPPAAFSPLPRTSLSGVLEPGVGVRGAPHRARRWRRAGEIRADNPRVGQRPADWLAVGLAGLDRDDLGRLSMLGGQGAQAALGRASITAIDELDAASAVEI